MKKRVWIFIAGEFFPPEIEIKADDFVIAVDSGIRHCLTMELSPDLHIGDFDSSNEDLLKKFPNCKRMEFSTDKDQTDFELALDFAIQKYPQAELHIIGSSGGEEDHALGNLLTLKKIPAPVYLWQENRLVLSAQAPYKLSIFANKGEKVSVFALEQLEGLTYSGLRWSLTKATLPAIATWAARNELVEDRGEISWEKGHALIFLPKSVFV